MGLAQQIAIPVGLLFVASGLLKVLALPEVEITQFMAKEFHRYADIFPLKHFGITIQADFYRTLVGSVEVAAGSLLALGRDPWRSISALNLLIIMIGAAYTHYAVDDISGMTVPAVLALLLVLFLNRS